MRKASQLLKVGIHGFLIKYYNNLKVRPPSIIMTEAFLFGVIVLCYVILNEVYNTRNNTLKQPFQKGTGIRGKYLDKK